MGLFYKFLNFSLAFDAVLFFLSVQLFNEKFVFQSMLKLPPLSPDIALSYYFFLIGFFHKLYIGHYRCIVRISVKFELIEF